MPSSGVGQTARTKRFHVILNTVERTQAKGVEEARLVETIMFNMGLRRAVATEHVAFLAEVRKLVRVDGRVYVPLYAPGGAKGPRPEPAPEGPSMEVLAASPSVPHAVDKDDGAHHR